MSEDIRQNRSRRAKKYRFCMIDKCPVCEEPLSIHAFKDYCGALNVDRIFCENREHRFNIIIPNSYLYYQEKSIRAWWKIKTQVFEWECVGHPFIKMDGISIKSANDFIALANQMQQNILFL
jgi:hypothetical protein